MNPKNKIEVFFKKFRKKTYKKNEIIISADQNIDNIFYITKGAIRQYFISPNGKEISISSFSVGSFIPMMTYLANDRNKHYFEASEKTEVYVAPATKVVEFIKDNNDIMFDLTIRMARGINGLLDKFQDLIQTSSSEKVVRFLHYLSKKSGTNLNDGFIELDISHSEIASWLGIERETVSRQIEKLEKMKIAINKNKKILINSVLLERIYKQLENTSN